jgi:hypothetical protein
LLDPELRSLLLEPDCELLPDALRDEPSRSDDEESLIPPSRDLVDELFDELFDDLSDELLDEPLDEPLMPSR